MSQDDRPKQTRQERLEAQLRENLRKRKEQARARRQSAATASAEEPDEPAEVAPDGDEDPGRP
ncbi:hypothetical protein VQ042_11945 [Aurantimonas sp. A2-1-M11]|uniref:hypothetical protein n=1 Tax=Aurantimonas sp. A2-1-M11 TaxID=3113712 RepID=UPI002F95A270